MMGHSNSILNNHCLFSPFVLLVLLEVLVCFHPLYAQEKRELDSYDIAGNTIRFPDHPGKWKFKIGAGLLFDVPPIDIVETSITAPLLDVHMVLGLPWKFSLVGDLTTIVVSSQLLLGARVGSCFRRFALNAGWDVSWVYGQFRPEGFNNVTKAWFHYPNISVGYKLKTMAFTVKAEAVYIAMIKQLIGESAANGITITNYSSFLNGFTYAFYLEQRLWKSNILVIGIKDNNIKYYWPTWMLFSTFDRYCHIPEFSLMLIL
jgi:hypothetical protein